MSDAGIIIPEVTSGMCDDDLVDDIAEPEQMSNSVVKQHQQIMRPSENSLIEGLPSMVSITRVPKPKPPDQGNGVANVRPPGSAAGGPPPPLLRLGPPGSAGLPPMPRLKLGGVRPGTVRPPVASVSLPISSTQSLNGMLGLVHANSNVAYPGSGNTQLIRTSLPNSQSTTSVTLNVPTQSMPIIAGTVSLHKTVTSSAQSPGILQQKLQGLPVNQRPQQQSQNAAEVARIQQQKLIMQQTAARQQQHQQALLRQQQIRQQQALQAQQAAIRAQAQGQARQAAVRAADATAAKIAAVANATKQAALNKQQLLAAQQLAAKQRLLKQKAAIAAAMANGRQQQQMNRPVQVRTVFVPPPMNNMSSAAATSKAITITNQVVRPSGTALIRPGTAITTAGVTSSTAVRTTAVASHTVNVPVAASLAFPLNIPNPANSGISITPISNGKSNKVEGVKESDYDDVEVDDSSDELLMDDDDDEYNEITEAPQSSVLPAPNVSGSVTLHRLLNSGEPVSSVKPTITVPVPLPLHLQPKPLHQLKTEPAQKLPTSQQLNIQANESVKIEIPVCAAVTSSSLSAAAVNGTASSSRRTSLESVASVGSTATSVDSGSGVPKARKSFKPNSRTSSPMQQQNRHSPAPTSMINNNQNKTPAVSAAFSQPPQLNGRLGSVDSNNSDPDSLKRDRDSVDYDEDRLSVTKKLKSANQSMDHQFYNESSFGTHFLSSLLPGNSLSKADSIKTTQATLNSRDSESSKEDESLLLKSLCTCEAECIPVPGKQGSSCQAVEVFGGYRVGCKNRVSRSELVKTSVDSEPVFLCDMHRDRLQSHACCPLCGEFCSHGLVFMCRVEKNSTPHLFHRFCYQLKSKDTRKCPHCSSSKAPLAVQLKLSMSRTPLRILNQTAKIAPFKRKNEDAETQLERWDVGKKRESFASYTLPSGKVISGYGLPNGLEGERLNTVIEEVKANKQTKQITRNMYQPTQAGDNVKLLQLLALDYSPKQKFTEANGGSPLHVAAVNNHVLTTHILVQAGAEVDALDDKNETPLMVAAIRGNADIIRYLVLAGANPALATDEGMTALHYATQNGHLECAHVLLSQNKLPRNFINVKDDGGWTPLVWACEHKHEGVIRYLLEQGADPHVMDVEMNVSLHWAAFSGSKTITDLLLSAGCNVNQANAIGETPLHIALRQDHYECALLLVARGARLDLPNSQGQLPSSCMSGENPKIESLINLGTTLHKLMKDRQQKFLSEKTVVQDISNGKENLPITAVNGEDFEMGPSGYTYVRNPVVTGNIPINRDISSLQHCKCTNDCISEDTCKCADNSTRSWYDKNGILKDGFDFQEPPMIFECNEMCGCNQNSCNNRVVQHGITARTQVYKTYGMGWGVKSMVDIPKGGFVCEYVGEIISDAQAEQRENDSYLFDLENKEGDTFCLDANKFGNVARFINHSCNPNLVPVKVFTSHQDLRFPHIAFFASKPIKRGDVLGFDYGEKFWVIKHKFFTCWCGGEKCKYSKWTIGKTLENYYKKIEETSSKTPDEASNNKTKDDSLNATKNATVTRTKDSKVIKDSDSKSPTETKQVEQPSEVAQPQTGKLKLKLRMEEGKVVKVDDSGLLPDEPDAKKSIKREDRDRKSPDSAKKGDSKNLEARKSSDDGLKISISKKTDEKKLEVKKSPRDQESIDRKIAELIGSIKGQEEKIMKLEAQIKEGRKSPVIKINKSAIAEYHKAKETKKALKQAAREEKKLRSQSNTPEPFREEKKLRSQSNTPEPLNAPNDATTTQDKKDIVSNITTTKKINVESDKNVNNKKTQNHQEKINVPVKLVEKKTPVKMNEKTPPVKINEKTPPVKMNEKTPVKLNETKTSETLLEKKAPSKLVEKKATEKLEEKKTEPIKKNDNNNKKASVKNEIDNKKDDTVVDTVEKITSPKVDTTVQNITDNKNDEVNIKKNDSTKDDTSVNNMIKNKKNDDTKDSNVPVLEEVKDKETPIEELPKPLVNATADIDDSQDEPMETDDNDAIMEHILEPTTHETEPTAPVISTNEVVNVKENIYETVISQDVDDAFLMDMMDVSNDINPVPAIVKNVINNKVPEEVKPVEKPEKLSETVEETSTPKPQGRALRTRQTPQSQPKNKNKPNDTPKAKADTPSAAKTAAVNGQAITPSTLTPISTKHVQTVNVSVAEEMTTIVESTHAESKASDTENSTDDVEISSTRKGRSRTTRRSVAATPVTSNSSSPAANKSTPQAAKSVAASTPTAKGSTAATAASAKAASSASKKESRAATPQANERPKRTRKSLADSKDTS